MKQQPPKIRIKSYQVSVYNPGPGKRYHKGYEYHCTDGTFEAYASTKFCHEWSMWGGHRWIKVLDVTLYNQILGESPRTNVYSMTTKREFRELCRERFAEAHRIRQRLMRDGSSAP